MAPLGTKKISNQERCQETYKGLLGMSPTQTYETKIHDNTEKELIRIQSNWSAG